MKKFLFYLVKIILQILLFFLVLEVAIRKIPNDYQLKKDYLNENAAEINTLILGSSHTFYGLNPEYFSQETFNAAYVSQSLDLDYEILRKYDLKLKNLKTVIIPISYFSLFETLETDVEKWRIKNYVIYYDLENTYQLLDHFESLDNHIALNVKKIIKYYVLNKSYITSSYLGWGTNFNSKNKKTLNGVFTAKKHTAKNFNLYDENIKSLQKIVTLCRKNKVKVIFITTPTHASYYHNLNKNQLEKTTKTISKFVKNNSNCEYINMLTSDKFTNEDFYDADHLNEIGAKKLSLFLNKFVTH
jgi:biopolymer transport protein ExbD